jgi:hypothetical protein
VRYLVIAVSWVFVLAAFAFAAPRVRRAFIHDVVTWDAEPGEPAPLPVNDAAGLPRTPKTRVVLVDGLGAAMTHGLPSWEALCKRGVDVTVDVGFPSVSLPVEVALWSGLTQQQTGIVLRSDRPLDPPLDKRGIPAQVPGSIAVAENHGWIVRSLGFAHVAPAADPQAPAKDAEPEAWKRRWLDEARAAVASDAPLVFVHVLEVDNAGHQHGGASPEYAAAARDADTVVGQLVAAAPDARWFALSDHGHLPGGGHGGEERDVRQVRDCIAGPGVPHGGTSLVHVVDIARAIADSVGAKLDPASRGRPLSAAIIHPLAPDQAIPPLPLARGAWAILSLVLGLALTAWGTRRWWLVPWWFIAAAALLLAIRGIPTLSTPMIFKPEGRDMWLAWLAALPIAAVATYFGRRVTTLSRVVAAQLALPVAAAVAGMFACGAWRPLFGAHLAPVVPHYTALLSPALLMAAQGAGAVALAILATLVPRRSGRSSPPAAPHSEPAAD